MASSKKKQNRSVNKELEILNEPLAQLSTTKNCENNIDILKTLFKDVDTLIIRDIYNEHAPDFHCVIAYSDGLVNSIILNENIIKPLMYSNLSNAKEPMADLLINKVVMINEVKKAQDFATIVEAVTYGDTILFTQDCSEAVILNTKGFAMRSVAEPENEKVLNGPREGFSEGLVMNLSLVRRRLRTNRLKMKYQSFGRFTKTSACICYIDGIVNQEALENFCKKLEKIDMDGVLDTNYIVELIKDTPYSPFRSVGYTEKPDVVVARLLEGRIALFLDGTPMVITVPYLFVENFQSGEDYYLNFYYSTFSRVLRIVGFFLTIGVPGFYLAVVAFHQEMLPTPLLISITMERKSVPFPAAIEAFFMLIVFDVVRETGIRVPSGIGQALSIVGALVIGQSAVEAKLVAAPMIIVVAITGITNLLVPKLNAPVIYLRMGLLFLSATLGMFGYIVGHAIVLIHILNLQSFGIPQVSPLEGLYFRNIKDSAFRAPWWMMKTRPIELSKNITRMSSDEGTTDEGN